MPAITPSLFQTFPQIVGLLNPWKRQHGINVNQWPCTINSEITIIPKTDLVFANKVTACCHNDPSTIGNYTSRKEKYIMPTTMQKLEDRRRAKKIRMQQALPRLRQTWAGKELRGIEHDIQRVEKELQALEGHCASCLGSRKKLLESQLIMLKSQKKLSLLQANSVR